jgi:hypothetical protein
LGGGVPEIPTFVLNFSPVLYFILTPVSTGTASDPLLIILVLTFSHTPPSTIISPFCLPYSDALLPQNDYTISLIIIL